MAYFPTSIVPKILQRETNSEVDGSPLICNARDHNIHAREIRAIECYLLGSNYGMTKTLEKIETLIDQVKRGSLFYYLSGTVPSNTKIPIPKQVVYSKTVGAIVSSSTNIEVEDASNFPQKGFATKINNVKTLEYCSSGVPVGGGDRCSVGTGVKCIEYKDFVIGGGTYITFQEFFWYDGIENNVLQNCIRGIDSTSAQDIDEGEEAIIINGKSSLVVMSNSWCKNKEQQPNQFYISMDSMLNVKGELLLENSVARINDPISIIVEIGYSWAGIGYFDTSVYFGDYSCQF